VLMLTRVVRLGLVLVLVAVAGRGLA